MWAAVGAIKPAHNRIGEAMSYLFVDGRYLTEQLRRWSERLTDRVEIELDYPQFFAGFDKAFYYAALPTQMDKEEPDAFAARLKKVEALHSTISAGDGCHVFNGKTVEGGKRLRQKGVDVMLAVHMLTHVFRGNEKNVTLLAGDADFVPLVKALVMEGANVTVRYAATSYAPDLLEAADRTQLISPVQALQRTTFAYRDKYPQPVKTVSADPHPSPKANILRKGKCTNGNVFLYEYSGNLTLMSPLDKHNRQFVRLSWYEAEHLVALAKEDGLAIDWD